MIDSNDLFLSEQSDAAVLTRAKALLQGNGFVPEDKYFDGTAPALLRDFLTNRAPSDLQDLIPRAEQLFSRDRPLFPEPPELFDETTHVVTSLSEPSLIWVDPQRIFPNQKYKDRGDWVYDPKGSARRNNDPLQGMAEFARRIAQERGDVTGLVALLGPHDREASVDLDGWETPLGAIFRVKLNGNHRAAALAVLGAPCIPATVHWNHGPFSVSTSEDPVMEENLRSYRTLLHCYGVASYPDLEHLGLPVQQVVSDWPILIDSADTAVHSLAAVESLAGRRHDTPIGGLPRELFDDAEALLSAGRRTRDALGRNLHRVKTGGILGSLRSKILNS